MIQNLRRVSIADSSRQVDRRTTSTSCRMTGRCGVGKDRHIAGADEAYLRSYSQHCELRVNSELGEWLEEKRAMAMQDVTSISTGARGLSRRGLLRSASI